MSFTGSYIEVKLEKEIRSWDVNVRLFGSRGRTVAKLEQFDILTVARPSPDAVIRP